MPMEFCELNIKMMNFLLLVLEKMNFGFKKIKKESGGLMVHISNTNFSILDSGY